MSQSREEVQMASFNHPMHPFPVGDGRHRVSRAPEDVGRNRDPFEKRRQVLRRDALHRSAHHGTRRFVVVDVEQLVEEFLSERFKAMQAGDRKEERADFRENQADDDAERASMRDAGGGAEVEVLEGS